MTSPNIIHRLLLIFLSLFSIPISAQTVPGYINNGNAQIHLWNDGNVFNDKYNYTGGYEIPANTNLKIFYMSSLLIGGLNSSSGDTLIATAGYDTSDFYFGPMVPSMSAADRARYESGSAVAMQEVEHHKKFWDSTGYTIPPSILNWPANGDTAKGELANMAPYADFNGNGVYDPENGDHPCVKGDYNIFMVFNDHTLHPKSFSLPMDIEVHMMAYTNADPFVVSNGIVLEYKVINRSSNDYEEVRLGMTADFDIGGYSDDHFGSDTVLNAFYGYNGDNFDEVVAGIGGYGNSPPAAALFFLDHDMTTAMTWNNIADPFIAPEFYRLLTGRWKEGALVYNKGNGTDTTGDVTTFMYPGDPADSAAWSEQSVGNSPRDIRGMGAIGPYALPAGSSIEFSMAVAFGRGINGQTNIQNVQEMKLAIVNRQNHFDTLTVDCEAGTPPPPPPPPTGIGEFASWDEIGWYPNPASETLHLKGDPGRINSVQVTNIMGEFVKVHNGPIARLDLSRLQNGLYHVTVVTDEGTATSRVVVQH